MFSKNKRSSISILVILGLTVIILTGVFSYTLISSKKEHVKRESEDIYFDSHIREKTKNYADQCLEMTVKDVIDKTWVVDEEILDTYIHDHYLECIDNFNVINEREEYEITFDDFKTDVSIKDKTCHVNLDFPIVIKRENFRSELNLFDYNCFESEEFFEPMEFEDNQILNFQDIQDYEMIFRNVIYKKEVIYNPYNHIHIVKMSLNDPHIVYAVTPPKGNTGVRTNFMRTSTFLYTFDLDLAINGDGWKRRTNNAIMGLAAYEGDIYGSSMTGETTVFIDRDNKVIVSIRPSEKPNNIWNAVSGFNVIVKEGENNKKGDTRPEPRTSVGLNEEDNILIFIIVDGRQRGYSVGIGLEGLGDLQIKEGATRALNMDGGGSTTLAIRGKLNEGVEGSPVVNSPSDNVEFEQVCVDWEEVFDPVEEKMVKGDCIAWEDGDAIPFTGDERIVANHLGLTAKPWP